MSYPFYDEDEAEVEAKPQPRQPKLPHCKFCPGREVISDGHGGYVHDDDYMYACTPESKATTFAEANL